MSENSELNPSSLIDLKAELHKKYDSFRKAKLTKESEPLKKTPFRSKLDQPKDKKIKPTPIVKLKAEDIEEQQTLRKSRLALEAKAKLYDKIVSNKILIDDEQNDSYLVDFQRKVLYEPAEHSSQHKTIEEKLEPPTQNTDTYQTVDEIQRIPPTKPYASESLSLNDPDQPIHYQGVQFNEIRDHGTGYFAFSTDETKRKEQMEELNSLRQNTEVKRSTKQTILKKRKSLLEKRLAKICERKNIDPSVIEAYKTEEPDTVQQPEVKEADLSSITPPEDKTDTPKKSPKVRPWDIGKESLQTFVPAKISKIYSQKEWLEERREERKSEFAPPSYYK